MEKDKLIATCFIIICASLLTINIVDRFSNDSDVSCEQRCESYAYGEAYTCNKFAVDKSDCNIRAENYYINCISNCD